MHEGAITKSILDTVIETVISEHIEGTVREVHVTVGVAQGLVPESMKMFFDMEKFDTLLEHAELVVEVQGMVGFCTECDREHVLEEAIMYCPDCASPMQLRKGNELVISAIEVEE